MFELGLWASEIASPRSFNVAMSASEKCVPWARIVPGTSSRPARCESLDEAAAESFAGDSLVDRVFGRVDVDADAEPSGEIDATGERFLLQREAGMGADHRGETAVGAMTRKLNA